MCGIFAYLNHSAPKSRQYILETLVNGLKRLEYRGYDSAGVAVDGGVNAIDIYKSKGKVDSLKGMYTPAYKGPSVKDIELARGSGLENPRKSGHLMLFSMIFYCETGHMGKGRA